MSNITIEINNREFLIACPDGEEERVLKLAERFSERVSKISERLNDLDHQRLFLIAGIEVEEDKQNILESQGIEQSTRRLKNILERLEKVE